MTETIKTVILNYAMCALVGGVLEYLAPEKTRKTLRVAVISVLLLAILSPIVKGKIEIESLLPQVEVAEDVNYKALVHTASLTEKKLRDEMKEILINEGVNEYEVYVTTTIDEEENTVYLEEIKIEVGKAFEHKIPSIKKKVSQYYQEVLKVSVKNE